MAIEVQPAKTTKDFKSFVKFPFELYRDDPQWVPPIISDEYTVLDPAKNPCQQDVDTHMLLARRDGQVVGRVLAMNHHLVNRVWDRKNLRFGWFECVEDLEVARALLAAVEAWGREQGLETLTGPQGFTDFDPEGMLIEGFEYLPTAASIYNPPYYPQFMAELGFEKEVDYIEFRSYRPREGRYDPKVVRLTEALQKRSKLRIRSAVNRREIFQLIPEALEILNEAYSEIHGYAPLTLEQLRYYFKRFGSVMDIDFFLGAFDEQDKLVGLALTIPSLSTALRKARGRLLPLGWYHLLKSTRERKVLDLYLIGVRKEYKGSGASLLLMMKVKEVFVDKGFEYSESNPMLEGNTLMQGMHKYFEHITHKRRRVFKKSLL
jgi:hypothetical protein